MIKVNYESNSPIYEQIQESIKNLILKGALKSQERLPSIRDLSCMLTVNPNTVSKAYSQLEKVGVIQTIKGKGTFITEEANIIVCNEYMKDFNEDVSKVARKAVSLGITFEELVNIEKEIYQSFGEGNYVRG